MEFFKKIIKHELINGSFYVFIGSITSSVFAFFLNLFLARNLSYTDYGIFASLLSIVVLASMPSNSISTIIVKFATTYYSRNEMENVSGFYFYAFKFMVLICILLFVLFTIFSDLISKYLNLDTTAYIFLSSITVIAFYLSAFNLAFLQSLMKFAFVSFVNSMGGVIKLITGVILVYLGFKAFSGLWSIFFMTLGSFLIAFIPLRQILQIKHKGKINIPRKEIINYSVPAFFTILFLTSFTSSDIILVKHFFSPTQAGYYAGLSLIGKVIFYFTSTIPIVMFPLLIKRQAMGQAYKKLFYLSLLLVFIPAFSISIFYYIFPSFTINLFLGGRDYLAISQYLGLFGLYLTVFSLVNVCVNFFLSFNETKIVYLVVFAAILQISIIYFFHADFYQVIYSSITIISLLLVSLLTYYYKKFNL